MVTIKGTTLLIWALLMFVLFGCLLLLVVQWRSIDAQYPPELIMVRSVAPGGERIALFSIKYQGTFLWGATDVEPHAYITVVNTAHGQVEARATEYHGYLSNSFVALADKYAPWAVEDVLAGPWGD